MVINIPITPPKKNSRRSNNNLQDPPLIFVCKKLLFAINYFFYQKGFARSMSQLSLPENIKADILLLHPKILGRLLTFDNPATNRANEMCAWKFNNQEDLNRFISRVKHQVSRNALYNLWRNIPLQKEQGLARTVQAYLPKSTTYYSDMQTFLLESPLEANDFSVLQKIFVQCFEDEPNIQKPSQELLDISSETKTKLRALEQNHLLRIFDRMNIKVKHRSRPSFYLYHKLLDHRFTLVDLSRLDAMAERELLRQTIELKWTELLDDERPKYLSKIRYAICQNNPPNEADCSDFWNIPWLGVNTLTEIVNILNTPKIEDLKPPTVTFEARVVAIAKLFEDYTDVKIQLFSGMLCGAGKHDSTMMASYLVGIKESSLDDLEAALSEDEARGLDACLMKEVLHRISTYSQDCVLKGLMTNSANKIIFQDDSYSFYNAIGAAWKNLETQQKTIVLEYIRTFPLKDSN